jgi:hypothetical protein
MNPDADEDHVMTHTSEDPSPMKPKTRRKTAKIASFSANC